MAPLHGDGDERQQKVNIRINDLSALNIHKAAVTRDYIKQPRLSKAKKIIYSINLLFLS
jgi:hypothetical protein